MTSPPPETQIPDPETAAVEASRMPITAHLGELRRRLVISLMAVGIGFGGAFFFSETLMAWLTRAIPVRLVFTAPTEALWAHLKVSLLAGILLGLPVILYQAYRFVAPGLYPRERRVALPFVLLGTLAFLTGMAFCYWVVFPFAITFLLTYKTEAFTPMLSVGLYVDFMVKFLLAFGVVFELPLVIVFLARMGWITPAFLQRNRKYAILVNFVLAAILTPTPDVFNQVLMAGPLILLYELGILAARWFARAPTDRAR